MTVKVSYKQQNLIYFNLFLILLGSTIPNHNTTCFVRGLLWQVGDSLLGVPWLRRKNTLLLSDLRVLIPFWVGQLLDLILFPIQYPLIISHEEGAGLQQISFGLINSISIWSIFQTCFIWLLYVLITLISYINYFFSWFY